MMFDIDILRIISNNIKPETGKILIAEPLLADNIFSRAVVYLVDDINNSHMGFILNHKSGMKIGEALDGFHNADLDLFLGGPVDPDVIHFLHGFKNIKHCQKIANNVFLDGDIDKIKDLLRKGVANKNNTRFFIGHSGWSKGQLAEEINNNSWLVADTKPNIVFNNPDKLWDKSLNLVDRRYQIWKNFPVNPEYN